MKFDNNKNKNTIFILKAYRLFGFSKKGRKRLSELIIVFFTEDGVSRKAFNINTVFILFVIIYHGK